MLVLPYRMSRICVKVECLFQIIGTYGCGCWCAGCIWEHQCHRQATAYIGYYIIVIPAVEYR